MAQTSRARELTPSMGWPFSSFSSLPYLFGTAPLLEGLAFEQLL